MEFVALTLTLSAGAGVLFPAEELVAAIDGGAPSAALHSIVLEGAKERGKH